MISAILRVVALLAISGSTIAVGPGDVNLGTAANYVILCEAGISTVPPSVITGNIGVSPASSTSLTGFNPITMGPGGTYSTCSQVTGDMYAANYNPPTPAILTQAVADMVTAYTQSGPTILKPPNFSPTTGNLGGLTLTGGIYKYTGSVTIPSSVTISGSATDTWVFQVAGTLTQSASTSVFLSGGALAKNIFWHVPGAFTIGTGATFRGIVLGGTSCTLETGATLIGRLLCQTACALQKATVSCC